MVLGRDLGKQHKKYVRIDLVTVFDAILRSRQTREKFTMFI